MASIKQTYLISSTPEKVWKALTNPKDIEAWGAGPAEMDDKVGTNFSLWDGDIFGKNIKVEKNKLLVQEWFGGKWLRPSIATFKITKKGNNTQVELKHEGIPEKDYENIKEGWKEYYMEPLKAYLDGY